MLDIKYIRDNPEHVESASKHKHFPFDIKKLLTLDSEAKAIQQDVEQMQATRNKISKEIGKASPEERENKKQEVADLKKNLEQQNNKLRELKEQLHDIMLTVAQPAAADVPLGKDDSENIEIKKWGTPPEFDFKAKDHVELGEKLGLVDIQRGVKLSGSRSFVFTGDGALLEQAILRFTYDYLVKEGFTPMTVPVLVNESCMVGTGYFPLGRDQAYVCERDEMALVGTSEVPLCSFYSDEVIANDKLPVKLMAQTPCFRREAGTYGKDTRGLYRVHQFNKIEMVVLGPNDPKISEELHDQLRNHAEHVLQSLELPYRVVYVCTGDLGQGQVRKHDIETWMPSRENYGETHSCSTFYDFQARRLNIKYKNQDGKRQLVHTLNNTACATPRIMLALLENHQTEDGKIKIPKALKPYLGDRDFLG